MAVIATTLTEFADQGNSRTYAVAGHTALAPRLVIQKRKVVTASASVAETGVKVVFGLVDTYGLPLASKATMDVVFRAPLVGTSGAVFATELALLREIVASDSFAAALTSQSWIKSN